MLSASAPIGRWKTRIGLLVALTFVVLAAALLAARRYGGDLVQTSKSPSHSRWVEIRKVSSLTALDQDPINIKVFSTSRSFGHTVVTVVSYGGDVNVDWRDDTHLVIYLRHPDQLVLYGKKERWNDVLVSYQETRT